MLKNGKKGKFRDKLILDAEAKMVFEQLKAAFVTAPMLPIIIQCKRFVSNLMLQDLPYQW